MPNDAASIMFIIFSLSLRSKLSYSHPIWMIRNSPSEFQKVEWSDVQNGELCQAAIANRDRVGCINDSLSTVY